MAKAKTAYVCADCGAEYSKWQGQCAECGAWNTLSSFVVQPAKSVAVNPRGGYAGAADAPKVTKLASIATDAEQRDPTGIAELDRVLGGGLVAGSVVLVGGDPGIGKSTLLLQMLGAIGQRVRGLYVT
ncbi:MAG: ATPase domain-containing protein, partial [Rhodanobacteraceae bacterium]